MQTREDVAREYDLDKRGCITNPGRFEGEHYSTVLAWEIVMDGAQDDTLYWPDETETDVIALDNELRAAWNCDESETYMLIEQSDIGFVSGQTVDQSTLDEITAECEKENERADLADAQEGSEEE